MAAKVFDEMNSRAADSVRAPYRGRRQLGGEDSPEKVAATRHEVDLILSLAPVSGRRVGFGNARMSVEATVRVIG